ncbi:MAG: hypothetical protein KDB68_07680 [Planctomycetes bacterium]|nr:hypothetical protein [Planctomycetota bacterium]
MSDSIVFPCPACGTKYSVGPHHAGKKTTCKKCGAPITVPTPQVANPTIVGGTRTIRRADIDPGESTRDEPVAAPSSVDVDMTGGAGVLRKEETVFGSQPVPAPPGTRGPTTRRPTGGPRPAPHGGRPMPPGMGGPPKKKNNMPVILGAVGGGIALILVVVLVIAMGGDSGGGGTDGTGDTGGSGDGGSVAQVSDDERLLETMKKQVNNQTALSLDQVRQYYQQARERKDNPEFKTLQNAWAQALNSKALSGASGDEMADIALMLDDDKYPEGAALLDQAWKALKTAGKATRTVTEKRDDGTEKKTLVPNKKFQDIVTRLGWKGYTYPEDMNSYIEYEIKGAAAFSDYYNFEVEQTYRDVGLFPPDIVTKLEEMQGVAESNWQVLKAKDDADGFALKARKAWIRFKASQDSKAKVDRKKGKRSFSPTAMERGSEPFDKIWTYTYWKPFIVFVEREIGQDDLDEDFMETLESKAALLKHEYDWFNEKLIQPFNLQRQKPQYNAKQAEEEGWPLEIIVLKDSATFEQFVLDSMGQPMPGARAFYSPLEERVMTFDDTSTTNADTLWFNESVLIHETFHMLSDFYHADPMFDMEMLQQRPSYTSILVQEGLTDSVSGFTREGLGGKATYEFLELNHLRLRSFKNIYEILDSRPLFRIRDMLEVRSYGQANQVAFKRAQELKVNPMWAAQNGVGIFYPTACQASYFFHHYKKNGKYVYRDKWWKFIGMDYKGEITLTSYNDNSAIAEFKKVFEIDSDEDFDKLDKEWLDYIIALKPEDVGKDGNGEVEGPSKTIQPGPIAPPPAPEPGHGKAHDAQKAAIPGRDEDKEAA